MSEIAEWVDRETMNEAARCVNTPRPLTRSTSTKPKEGLAMQATRICTVDGCDKTQSTRKQLCEVHYYRMRKFGSYELPPTDYIKDRACAADGCDTQAKTKGYCGKHWERIKRHGHPDTLLVIHDGPERFMSYVEQTEGCWFWRGTLTWDGYGLFRDQGRRTGAHRHAYEFFVGPIPAGLQIDHLCRVRNCVRPDHLEPVTAAENTRRASVDLGSTCRHGHTHVVVNARGTRYCPDCRREKYLARKAPS